MSVIGNGVVVDPSALLSMKTIRDQGVAVSPDNLVVSDAVSLILPFMCALTRPVGRGRGRPIELQPAKVLARPMRTKWPAAVSAYQICVMRAIAPAWTGWPPIIMSGWKPQDGQDGR